MTSPPPTHSAQTSDPISTEQSPKFLSPISSPQTQPAKAHWYSSTKGSRREHNGPSATATAVTGKSEESSSVNIKELTRGNPADGYTGGTLSKTSTRSQREVAKQRSQYFDEVFSTREPYHTPRHRVNQDSIVVVEIKTNILLQDDFHVLSELSLNLAQIFQRPESSILLYVEHNCCLMFGSSYEPAYLTTVSALACSVAPLTNLRHTALIQAAINDTLNIPSNRGVIKFECMAEENFATNGATIKDEIEQLERCNSNTNNEDQHGGVFKTISRSMSRKVKANAASTLRGDSNAAARNSNQQRLTAATPTPTLVLTPVQSPPNGELATVDIPEDPPEEPAPSPKAALTGKEKVIKKCQSIKQLFFR
ncbi:hypothetical protein AJ79_09651 [Helicocarpus griseus UAMH5409]|uniref:L-dopachrome isomerase n=1 Tax=Helicocarpus griseus UAMH5409 TaxID=1447875 RepID=A0A2B7WI96_9EURO|nr:hypothetical protein AJ79_09651 [Helicocarpus griseus UAMH5409]